MNLHRPDVQAPRRIDAVTLIPLALFVLVTLGSFQYATQWTAAALAFQRRLGSGLFHARHSVV